MRNVISKTSRKSEGSAVGIAIRIAVVLLCGLMLISANCAGLFGIKIEPPVTATPGDDANPDDGDDGDDTSTAFTLTSESFNNGEAIPAEYHFTPPATLGPNPELSWTNIPEGTIELILIVHDSLAAANNFVHWVVYDIPPTLSSIPKGTKDPMAITASVTYNEIEVKQAFNDYAGTMGNVAHLGYDGPSTTAPPGTHVYEFTLYALNEDITPPTEPAAAAPAYHTALIAALTDKIIDDVSLSGTVERTAVPPDGGTPTPITGTGGDDTLSSTAGDDTFVATAGADTISSFSLATGNSDTIDFSDFTGANAVDINDLTIAQSTGADTDNLVITGFGTGNMLTLDDAFANGGPFYADGAALSLNAAISLLTPATTGPLTGLEDVTGQGTSAVDTLTAAAGAGSLLFGFEGVDELTAHADGSVLFGGDDNDMLSSAAGADGLYGGGGSDTALYASSSTFTVTAAGAGYTVVGGTPYGTDTLIDIETIQLSGMDDTVEGLSAALSDITIDGGAGTDTIALADTGVTLDLSAATNYTNFETITGGTGDDTITGGTGDETINGGDGADTLSGGAGDDTFVASAGADTISSFSRAAGNNDTIDFSGFTVVIGALSFAQSTGADTDNLVITGFGVVGDMLTLNDAFAAGGALEAGTYVDDMQLTMDFHNDTNGITAADFFSF